MTIEAPAGDSPVDAPVTNAVDDANALPFVAPCRTLDTWEPIGWLAHAWRDFKAAPRQSLTYGTIVVLLSWSLSFIAIRFGGYFELLALVSGFILVAPLLAVGTYSISEQIERGLKPSLRRCFIEERRAFGNLMVFALMLMIVFAAAAFSLPMLFDRDVDSITAVVTSINAVLRNKPAMAVWAAMIVLAVAPGFAMLLIGREKGAGFALVMALLGLTLPLIGHATWHAYRATIDASAWPRNEHLES